MTNVSKLMRFDLVDEDFEDQIYLGSFNKVQLIDGNAKQTPKLILSDWDRVFLKLPLTAHDSHVKLSLLQSDGNVFADYPFFAQNILYHEESNTLTMEGEYLPLLSSKLMDIWKKYREQPPQKLGEWQLLDKNARLCWLKVALLDKRRSKDVLNSDVVLLGETIHDFSSFLCAFGESAIGVGGYFGQDLSGFTDFLTGWPGKKYVQSITWLNYADSVIGFKKCGELDILNKINQICDSRDIDCRVYSGSLY